MNFKFVNFLSIVLIFNPNLQSVQTILDAGFGYSADSNQTAEIWRTFPGSITSPVIKFSLDRHLDQYPHRTEIVPKGLPEPHFHYGKFTNIGTTYIYEFQHAIPSDWIPDIYPEIITQWHSQPDLDLGENYNRTPPLALHIGWPDGGNRYILKVKADSNQVTQFDSKNNPIFTETHDYDLGTVVPNSKTTWKFIVKWGYDNTGVLQVFKNGVMVLNVQHGNCYNDQFGPWQKIGIYKSKWKDPNKPDGPVTSRVYYYKGIKISVVEE